MARFETVAEAFEAVRSLVEEAIQIQDRLGDLIDDADDAVETFEHELTERDGRIAYLEGKEEDDG